MPYYMTPNQNSDAFHVHNASARDCGTLVLVTNDSHMPARTETMHCVCNVGPTYDWLVYHLKRVTFTSLLLCGCNNTLMLSCCL